MCAVGGARIGMKADKFFPDNYVYFFYNGMSDAGITRMILFLCQNDHLNSLLLGAVARS